MITPFYRLSALDPGKQGLKLRYSPQISASRPLSALDPGKQGLKLPRSRLRCVWATLSALDPGKQGLKHHVSASSALIIDRFQRLIQENKD